jgi:hypothetical protein
MKKLYAFIFSALTISGIAQVASCSVNPVFVASNKTGIWPDSATNFVAGTVNSNYLQNITVKVPKDTVTGFGTFCFNRVELSNPSGFTNFNLPPGLTLLAGNNVTITGSTYKFSGNATTCALISGTPTLAGTYTVQFKVQPYISTSPCTGTPNTSQGSAITPPTTLAYYIITIGQTSIKEEVSAKSLNISNIPNPFTNKTSVKFTVKDEAPAKICVYNLLGDKIFEDKFKTVLGDNTYELNASDWYSGIYLYSLQYKNHTETKRMILNGNR